MTTPSERTRALRWGYDFMVEAWHHPQCPAHLRQQAAYILEHYPQPQEIANEAERSVVQAHFRVWMGPESDHVRSDSNLSFVHNEVDTTPPERSRALRWCLEFLKALRRHDDTPDQLGNQVPMNPPTARPKL